MPSGPELTGMRKAAVLMILLGEEVAGKLIKHLSPEQAARIAREVATLGPIDPQLADGVLQDYFSEALRPEERSGGAEFARRLLARAVPADQVDRLLGVQDPTAQFLKPVLEAPSGFLAGALAQEQPQAAALILLNLPPERSAGVLRSMPAAAQGEVLLRMASLRRVRGGMLGEIASSLGQRLQAGEQEPAKEAAEQGSLDGTAAVLSALNRNEMRRLLEELKGKDAERAAALHEKIFTFDSLALADGRGIQEMLRRIDTKKLAIALRDAGAAVSDKIMGNMSERAAGMLRDEIEVMGKGRPEEQQAARKEILALALELEQAGTLTFGEEGGNV
ncbi:MAG TPA: FliG C-terminal domain-containing protein [Candidatus Polarisedimenticolia bacterium]|nr:FliG C-terminal domain-containing protein [Candidatus Polarisedimenticolia bacterium]